MSRPTTDAAAVRRIVTALVEAGHMPYEVGLGIEVEQVSGVEDAVAEVTAVDISRLFVRLSDGTGTAWVLFVMGNGDPLDLVADWTTTLTPVIDPIMATW